MIVLSPGNAAPLGATVTTEGVNFSVYSKHATGLEILFFDDAEAAQPSHVLQLDPKQHRSFHYWHALVHGVRPGQIYAYRASGPWLPEQGFRFDPQKVLLDPYARAVAMPTTYDRAAAARPGENFSKAMKSVVVDTSTYDWEGDKHPRRSFISSVVYEMHVGGFTRNPNSGVSADKRGTYAGLIEKIPYLQSLGITAVELLPIFHFDEQDAPRGKKNYWGYSPVAFFAPHVAFSSDKSVFGPLNEFRDMVKALHKAGIEVILDVVYNHTFEGDERGPTSCFRGLDNKTYYILHGEDYSNYSGTGNTLNASNSVVGRMIQDSLRYWVREMHVDGFRFDLASILTRDERGRPLDSPHTLWSIETDPVLVDTKLIAEPWDAGGLYEVGSFIGDRWLEWNGRFRDDVRAFIKGAPNSVRNVPNRLLASPDLYSHKQREPEQSVNFVTCHDGFTLNDLVSYDTKHNEANGENNQDGSNDNLSWNCGVEGPTQDPKIETLRNRQVKNLLLHTLIAAGVPMLLMGDEVRRSQSGNNNAYCQDNELSWLDWSLLEKHADVRRFVQLMIGWRLRVSPERDPGMTLVEFLRTASIEWHGVELHKPDWGDNSHALALTVHGRRGHLHAMFNAYWQPLTFQIPPRAAGPWRCFVDTSQVSPLDITPVADALPLHSNQYTVGARSTVLLIE